MAMCEKINTFKILKILLLSCLALLILQYIINIVVYNSKSNIFGLEVLFQQYATNKSRNETLKYRTTSRTDSPEVNIPSNTSVNNNTRTTAVSKTPLPLSTKIITTKIVSNITTTRPTTTTKKPEKNDTSTTLGITLPLCPMVPPDLVGQLATYTSAKTFDDIYKENSLLEPGGRYRPKDCVARHRVAIVIPYRNRENHLKIFLKNIHPILQRQQLDYGIYVIDMELPTKFNRAMLMNIGYNESLQIYDYQCFIFHDVDLIPENDKNIYSCPKNPRHMSVAIDKFKYKLPYASIFGGVSALTKDQMIKTNGFSNKFFGWGGEDDDMYSRIHNKGYKISRYSVEIARYKMIKHDRDSSNPLNKDRHKLIASGKSRQEKDGVNSLKYTVVKREFTPTYTYILTKIDEDQVMKSRSTKYRKKLKISHPEKYLENQKLASKIRRDELKSDMNKIKPDKIVQEKHDKVLIAARIRQQRYRDKKKKRSEEEDKDFPTKLNVSTGIFSRAKVSTRSECNDKREYWRVQKQKEREKIKCNPQQLRRFREKDRQRKKKKTNTEELYDSIWSKKSQWNTVSKVRKTLPNSPAKFVFVIQSLIKNSTPHKKNAFIHLENTSPTQNKLDDHLASAVKKLKKTPQGRKAAALISKSLNETGSISFVCRSLGINRKFSVKSIDRKIRSDAIPAGIRKKVEQFFLSPQISRALPQKKFVTKHGPGFLLSMSLAAAFMIFKKEFKFEIGFRKFCELKPRQVRLLKKSHLNSCVCPYCANILYKLDVVNRLVDVSEYIKDENSLINRLLCVKSDSCRFHDMKCITEKCSKCSDYSQTLSNYYKNIPMGKSVHWLHWERIISADGKKKRDLVIEDGCFGEFLEEFCNDITKPVQGSSFPYHLFVAHWQYSQYARKLGYYTNGLCTKSQHFCARCYKI